MATIDWLGCDFQVQDEEYVQIHALCEAAHAVMRDPTIKPYKFYVCVKDDNSVVLRGRRQLDGVTPLIQLNYISRTLLVIDYEIYAQLVSHYNAGDKTPLAHKAVAAVAAVWFANKMRSVENRYAIQYYSEQTGLLFTYETATKKEVTEPVTSIHAKALGAWEPNAGQKPNPVPEPTMIAVAPKGLEPGFSIVDPAALARAKLAALVQMRHETRNAIGDFSLVFPPLDQQ